MLACSLVLATGYIAPARPIAQPLHLGRARAAAARLQSPSLQANDGPLASVQTAYTIFQASQAEGVGFKQAVADALAGEYDRDAITAEVQAAANASPLALFRVATCVLPQPWAYAYTRQPPTPHIPAARGSSGPTKCALPTRAWTSRIARAAHFGAQVLFTWDSSPACKKALTCLPHA